MYTYLEIKPKFSEGILLGREIKPGQRMWDLQLSLFQRSTCEGLKPGDTP
jgi:hypothetical protein